MGEASTPHPHGQHNVMGLPCRIKYARLKYWRGFKIRDWRTVRIDVIVEGTCRQVRKQSCKKQLHLELPSPRILHDFYTPSPECAPPRGHTRHCSRTGPIPTFLTNYWAFKTLLLSLPPDHEYWPPCFLSRMSCMCLLPSLCLIRFPVWSAFCFLLCLSSAYHPLRFSLDSFIPPRTHWVNSGRFLGPPCGWGC